MWTRILGCLQIAPTGAAQPWKPNGTRLLVHSFYAEVISRAGSALSVTFLHYVPQHSATSCCNLTWSELLWFLNTSLCSNIEYTADGGLWTLNPTSSLEWLSLSLTFVKASLVHAWTTNVKRTQRAAEKNTVWLKQERWSCARWCKINAFNTQLISRHCVDHASHTF